MLLLDEAGKLPLCRPLRCLAVESRIPEPDSPFPPPYLFLPLLCSKALVDLSFLPVPTPLLMGHGVGPYIGLNEIESPSPMKTFITINYLFIFIFGFIG